MRERLLIFPARIQASLDSIARSGVLPPEEIPNLWQVQLGILRMWHRVFFRSETIGQSSVPVADSWRARLLSRRPLRFPFLLREKMIAPLDFSGLASPPWRIKKHLLGAYHDGDQFVYDLELLMAHEGGFDELLERARKTRDDDDRESAWLRDLVVYERYHERLVEALESFEADQIDDPDISFFAYLRWCARQPKTMRETVREMRAKRYSIADGARAS